MSKLTKNQKLALAKLKLGNHIHVKRSISFSKRNYYNKFDASVDIDVRLGS
jgi:large subunit ribosomal protein L1